MQAIARTSQFETHKNIFMRLAAMGGLIAMMLTLWATPSQAAHHKSGHAMDKDIVDTAVAAGSFKTLAAALTAADLVGVLKGEGPFTVFAPTDEAFAKLPAGTLENLLKPENKKQLAAILTYHVVSGKVMSGDLLKLNSAKTVNGQPISIGLKVNGDNVTTADIAASNGVIHVIDSVILPK
jgi:uncharacterized surface protein with fasciclin (FAS1) repeats